MNADISIAERKPPSPETPRLNMTFISLKYPGGKGDEQKALNDFENFLNPKRSGCYDKAQGRIDLYRERGFSITDYGKLQGEWEKGVPDDLKRTLGKIDPETVEWIKNTRGDYIVRQHKILENEITTTESFISEDKIKIVNAQSPGIQPPTTR
ncbi:MAG: hypothetical protein ABH816_03975 [Candidatus Levyibacteriota bacterium]